MGDIKTTMFQPTNLQNFDLAAYATAWQKLLQDIGLLEKTATDDDVLIVRFPTQEKAISAYQVVTTIQWSANNPDFSQWGCTGDLRLIKQEMVRMVQERIVSQFFPELSGKKLGYSVWLQRLDSAVFCIVN
jgi:hypothetical protein